MELHYLNFCHAGNPFYDLPPAAADDFPAATEPLPTDWTRRGDSEWVYLVPPENQLPPQGWKIHVSATLENAERILDVVWQYCVAQRVMFKFIRSLAVLARRNSKYGDRSSSGKFFTIYPVDESALEKVLRELGDLLDGEAGPYILSDLRWRSGPLYVRYGGFALRYGRSATGELIHCIEDPDGRLVPDVRGPSFKPPSWVQMPDCLAEALAARNAGRLGGFPFRATRALHFSNGGGVYEATDTRTGETVLLKEARPLAGLDEVGRDAVARLEQERWALTELAGLACIPKLVEYRVGHEHYFLAREYVAGKPLTQEVYRRNPLMNNELSAANCAEYTRWALRMIDQVERGMRAMHERGVVFGDLHPNNVLVRADDSVIFIDLETSSESVAAQAQAIGAPGFRAPVSYQGTAVDEYGLGCLRLAMFLPLTIVAAWGPEKVDQLIEIITGHFPVPADFADQVWRDLGPAPYPDAPERSDVRAPIWPRLDQRTWPALRDDLVRALLSTATPDRPDRLFPGDVAQFRTPGGGLGFANGAAGVLWTVAELGAAVPAEHVDWLVDAVGRLDQARPGFYDGLAGIAYALDRLGRTDLARETLDRAVALPRAEVDNSLHAGLAGLGLALLHFARPGADDDLLAKARQIADDLAERGDGSAMGKSGMGLLHGASGVGLFLLRLYQRTLDRTLLDRASQAVRDDLGALGWAGDGTPAANPHWRSPLIGTGSAGVGMLLRDLVAISPEEELAQARDAIRAVLKPHFMMNSGLFRGRAGTMLALRHLHDGDVDTEQARTRHVANLGWHAVLLRGQVAFLGDHNLRLSMDLGTGLAGVLLSLEAELTDNPVQLPFFPGRPE